MSTLTYTHGGAATVEGGTADTAPRKGFWRRVYEAMVASQQRRAEREIAAYLSTHGGLFTDDMEREMMRRLSGNGRRSV
jgi:hypothetical protein